MFTRLLREYEHAEMYFVVAPNGAAMVTNVDQMELRRTGKFIPVDEPVVEKRPSILFH